LSVSRNTAYNVVGAVTPLLLSLVTVPIYLRLVGSERYGVLAIAWLLLGYFGLFDLGLGRSTAFRIASQKGEAAERRTRTFWTALTINIGMGLIGAVLLLGAATYFFGHIFKVSPAMRAEIMAAVPLLACAVPIATVTGVLTGAMQGREKFLQTNIVSTISTALFQLFPLSVAYFWSPNLTLLLGAAILARLCAICVLIYWCVREFVVENVLRIDVREAALLLKYGGWVNLTSLIGPALVMVDRFAIGAVLGATAVTIYTVPFQLTQRIQVVPGALTNALFPRLSSVGGAEQRVLVNTASMTILGVISVPVLGAIFLLEPFLRLWVGPHIGGEAAQVGRIMLIGFWVNSFALLPFVRLQASGRPDLVAKTLIAEVPFYLLALYVALQHFSYVGAAVVFSVRCLVDYGILSLLSGSRLHGWRATGAVGVLLSIGVYFAGVWAVTDWRLWATALALGGVVAGICIRSLPAEIASRLRRGGVTQVASKIFPGRTGR
jgi:Membrane protein involved in the export of O-antigen and teichoic acid